MGSSSFGYSLPLIIILILIPQIFTSNAQPRNVTNEEPFKNSTSAVIVFGDSTVDAGNNNYVPTAAKCNYPPYGRDFVNHKPTGRFSNGRLVTDFIASFLGVKEFVPAYLEPNLSTEELMTGVSFASGGSGYDPFTCQITGALNLSKQLDLFREYKARLENAIGKKRTQDSINRAGFIVSAGINDFIANYYGVPVRRLTYPTVSSFQNFLLQKVEHFIQDLLEEGAKKIVIIGVPPLGCFPATITINSDNPVYHRQCIDRLNSVARDYNNLLQDKLKGMQKGDSNVVYADIYSPVIDMIQEQSKFGFEDVNRGCCGTGLIEVIYLCNALTPVCNDATKYLFWDSIHPTEEAYYIIFNAFRPLIQKYIA